MRAVLSLVAKCLAVHELLFGLTVQQRQGHNARLVKNERLLMRPTLMNREFSTITSFESNEQPIILHRNDERVEKRKKERKNKTPKARLSVFGINDAGLHSAVQSISDLRFSTLRPNFSVTVMRTSLPLLVSARYSELETLMG